MTLDISNIDFGEVSAEAERVSNPSLIKSGFVDINSIEKEAMEGKRFLFLGYKGSGKSSIAERLDLNLGGKHNSFVTKISLADFPFTPFSKIIKGDTEPEAKFPTAWAWILLVYVIDSFNKDASKRHPRPEVFQEAVKAFYDLGISPSASPSSIVRTSSQKGFSAKLPYDIFSYHENNSTLKPLDEIYNFVDAIKRVVTEVRSNANHFLIIDGLDEILSSRNVQYKSLYALIYETAQLNILFQSSGVPFKIIILCRTDLFDRTPGPNKNKIRQAYAFEIDWYHDPNDPKNSLLVKAANLRAKLSLKRDVDIFEEFFPKVIYNTPTILYLLDMTRHTPRDFLQLLSYLKRFSKNGKLSEDGMKSGLREYSIKYFYPEVHDELAGYVPEEVMNSFFHALGRMRTRDFLFQELERELSNEGIKVSHEQAYTVCSTLFDCSALGNIEVEGSKTYYTFKYRNRLSTFTKSRRIVLHRGLWKALNIH